MIIPTIFQKLLSPLIIARWDAPPNPGLYHVIWVLHLLDTLQKGIKLLERVLHDGLLAREDAALVHGVVNTLLQWHLHGGINTARAQVGNPLENTLEQLDAAAILG